jgi:CRISPR/Cas system-associated exonuclease Cas4 (RecB family)
MYILTKSKITSGLQCTKKLWFDVNDPIKKELHIFYIGNRFGDFSRIHYGPGLNLEGQFDVESVLSQTRDALADPTINVIYEAAFLSDDVLIRADVLLRNANQWEMIEVKSSTSQKQEHIADAAVQAFIIRACGVDLSCVKIGHINKEFIYEGFDNYDHLLTEVDITNEVNLCQGVVKDWINQFKPIATKGAPEPVVEMGEHCTHPNQCPYQERCATLLPQFDGVPINLLPYVGAKLEQEWAEKGVRDLRDIPLESLKKPMQQMIHIAHSLNKPVINSALSATIKSLSWPRFFMDFETVQQGVPIMAYTKPYDALPFQWSVHRWNNPDHQVQLKDGVGFLEFYHPNMDRNFLESLLNAVGTEGPIFVHSASFEKSKLKALTERDSCQDLKSSIDALIARIIDTRDLTKDDGFYSPKMNGSFSLKDIVKAIPTKVDYSSEDALTGGGEAQIVWFKCTDPDTPEAERAEWARRLKNYCAQDTLAMYDLIRYLEDPVDAVAFKI